MGRMHAPGKGLSQSALPYRRSVPTWLKLTSDDVKEQIYKLAKKGLTPSQIGVILRDSHGVAQVRFVTGNKILRILKSKGLAPDLPEDLYHLIKKAVAVRKHLERNRKRVEFTDWLDITRPSESFLPTGNMSRPQPLPWLHKFVYVLKQ
ncbi:40S ribosomal protein S13 isoform X2 [Carlito syrichta]|uniref:Small ribosomal subunit protein uS15 n=1 Tax=Carlito syrichta TaxID=1868482 RepID=A0A3Q0EF28_CARSF|nr:40S ribosomal protein S13 isoform X2 [Carlito syrichta]